MLVNEFTIWRENNDINRKKVFEELLLSFKDQSEKLKKAICADTDRQAKYNKLQNAHDAISDELKIVKCNKNNLECRLEDSEKNIKCLQKELRYTKVNNFLFFGTNVLSNNLLRLCTYNIHYKYVIHKKIELFGKY